MLQKLQFRPGVNREGTTLTNEGGWFQCDKIRFRSGQVEKIGGWTVDTGTVITGGQYIGVCRDLWNWVGLSGYNYLSIATNQKFYIQLGVGGNIYDITPIRAVISSPSASFAATTSSTTIVVTQAGHGAQSGDFVTFTGAVSLGGAITAAVLNLVSGYQITYISGTQYSITTAVAANASDVGTGGGAVTAAYQITSGNAIYSIGVGWGAGGWGGNNVGFAATGWGSAAPASQGIGSQLRLWSQYNFGQNLILNPRGGALYYWAVNSNPNTVNVAQVLSSTNTNTQDGIAYWQTDINCPSICNFVLVSDASRFVIGFGVNDYGSSTLSPMLVRWSDQESVVTWTPTVTNQAGSYSLSHGSFIIAAMQTRQEILVWTDTSLYSMQYLGAPYVWGFTLLSTNHGLAGPNATAVANNIAYWMGQDKFYSYSGQTQTLPCTLRQYVFQNLNYSQSFQFFAGTNEGYNEIWWFYCSASSTVIDRYVIYNYLEQIWYYGTLTRTAWIDSSLRQYPMAAGYGDVNPNAPPIDYAGIDSAIIYHESQVDDGTTNPPSAIAAYIQSSDFDIGDGHNFGFVWRVIPDVSFDGSSGSVLPSVNFTVLPRQNPGANYGSSDYPVVTSLQSYAGQSTYNVQQFTQYAYCRLRGRQMALVVSSNQVGTQWQLGSPRLDVRPDGRK